MRFDKSFLVYIALVFAGVSLLAWVVGATGATPNDCQRACEPACMVEFVAESDAAPAVCRCGACP